MKASAGLWHYDRRAGLERATGRGRLDGLRMHFHAEHQFTLVIAGSRRFRTPAGTVAAGPGGAVFLPAGLAHEAVASGEEEEVVSVNLYLPAAAALGQGWPDDPHALADLVPALDTATSLAALARSLGIARETFARRFRRATGMTPRAYRLMGRLNRARALLRAGEEPAAAAAEAGFADQSHLGRHFRAAFGTSPAAYRRGFCRPVCRPVFRPGP